MLVGIEMRMMPRNNGCDGYMHIFKKPCAVGVVSEIAQQRHGYSLMAMEKLWLLMDGDGEIMVWCIWPG